MGPKHFKWGWLLLGSTVVGVASLWSAWAPSSVAQVPVVDAFVDAGTTKTRFEHRWVRTKAAPDAEPRYEIVSSYEPVTSTSPPPPDKSTRVHAAFRGSCPADGGTAPGCFRCTTDADCPSGLTCGADEGGGMSCLAPGCQSDEDCPGTQSCRVVSFDGVSNTKLRQCRDGERQAGESCKIAFGDATTSCGRGLECNPDGRCQKRCETDDDCDGLSCVDSPMDGKVCAEVCTSNDDCGQGQECVAFGTVGSYCRFVAGEDCKDTCGEGQTCMRRDLDRRVTAFYCADCCNPLDPGSCGPGRVCGAGPSGASGCNSVCYKACSNALECSGGPGHECITVDEEFETMGCVPGLTTVERELPDGGVQRVLDGPDMSLYR